MVGPEPAIRGSGDGFADPGRCTCPHGPLRSRRCPWWMQHSKLSGSHYYRPSTAGPKPASSVPARPANPRLCSRSNWMTAAELYLTTAIDADRTGKPYPNGFTPDEIVPFNGSTCHRPSNDPVVLAAQNWLVASIPTAAPLPPAATTSRSRHKKVVAGSAGHRFRPTRLAAGQCSRSWPAPQPAGCGQCTRPGSGCSAGTSGTAGPSRCFSGCSRCSAGNSGTPQPRRLTPGPQLPQTTRLRRRPPPQRRRRGSQA